MKIGVALSGCDIGGVSAYTILHHLREMGLDIEMISASGLAAVGAFLFACRRGKEKDDRVREAFLRDLAGEDLDNAIANLAGSVKPRRMEELRGFAASAQNTADGKVITFTNDYVISSDTLETVPLTDGYDILSACVGPVDGLASYPYRGYRLSDYSARYGSPVYPLRMAGLATVVSLSFLPLAPANGYDVLLTEKLERPREDGIVQLSLKFPPFQPELGLEQYDGVASFVMDNCRNDLLLRLLDNTYVRRM